MLGRRAARGGMVRGGKVGGGRGQPLGRCGSETGNPQTSRPTGMCASFTVRAQGCLPSATLPPGCQTPWPRHPNVPDAPSPLHCPQVAEQLTSSAVGVAFGAVGPFECLRKQLDKLRDGDCRRCAPLGAPEGVEGRRGARPWLVVVASTTRAGCWCIRAHGARGPSGSAMALATCCRR